MDKAFQPHIPYFIDCANSPTHNHEFRNLCLQILSNLALRKHLQNEIAQNPGLNCFLNALRDERNVAGRRIAAKALAHVCNSDEELRIGLISELADEV